MHKTLNVIDSVQRRNVCESEIKKRRRKLFGSKTALEVLLRESESIGVEEGNRERERVNLYTLLVPRWWENVEC